MNKNMKKIISYILSISMLVTCILAYPVTTNSEVKVKAAVGDVTTSTMTGNAMTDKLMEKYTSFILIKHRSLGGSHYAYTEGLAEELAGTNAPDGTESNFFPGSQMVRLDLSKNGSTVTRKETVLIDSPNGVVRDPDVSTDGTKVLFSWKKNRTDEFHLYEYNLKNGSITQLTYGTGQADIEPKYLPNGKIVFSSSRIIQTVDCWITPVSNTYICDADGKNIIRVGYDQVHTTYPTVTSDGRILYTRWDYSDRSQMYVQGVFQMFQDGTGQTEVYGNNCNFPTTLLHTREIPGTAGKYISIASGHHVYQAGKLVVVDTRKGRNSKEAIEFVVKDGSSSTNDNIDAYGQSGALYKYPFAITDSLYMTAYCGTGWASDRTYTPFGISLFDANGNRTELVPGSTTMPCSQIVPITTRTLFERASMVNYGKATGTYYVANVYEGEGTKGVEKGAIKYLRVVALDFREYAIGATQGVGTGTSDPYTPVATGNGTWDVKRILGIVPVEEDGSALFEVPAEESVYFQLLNENGEMIQTMRTWSTLMPGETFSCVGCHADKNTVPIAQSTTTMAMAKGVQKLQPDLWMKEDEDYKDYDPYSESKGFDYLEEVQPIFDESCIQCHSNTEASYDSINVTDMNSEDGEVKSTPLELGAQWKYTTSIQNGEWYAEGYNDSSWNIGYAPFGTANSGPGQIGTVWNSDKIFMRTEFNLTKYQMKMLDMSMTLACLASPKIYVNGTLLYSNTGSISAYTTTVITNTMKKAMRVGKNTIAIEATKSSSKENFVGISINTSLSETNNAVEVISKNSTWKYYMSNSNNVASGWNTIGFNDSSWNTASAPFGDRDGYVTAWNGDNKYIWIRKTFNIDNLSEFNGCSIKLDTYYDDNPYFYLNGHLIYRDTQGNAWVDGYTTINLGNDLSQYLVQGTNVLAIQCSNDTGGRQIDSALYLTKVKLIENEFISTGSDWKYKMSTSNNIQSGWNGKDFDDSSWNTAKAPFGDREGKVTDWSGNNKYIWIRKSFDIEDISEYYNASIILNTYYDDNPQFYLNGHLIYTDTEGNPWVDGYTKLNLGSGYSQYLVEGKNTIAIQCSNDTGGRQIDTSFVLATGGVTERELIPTRDSNWKYTKSNPGNGWMNEGYNDGGWSVGNAPFGSNSTCQTSWTGDNTDIWLRKTFNVNDVEAIKNMKMYLNVFYDEDPTIYINGTEIYSALGYTTEYKIESVAQEFTKLLKQGTNTIAIHAHNSYGGLFIDTGLSLRSTSSIPFSLESTNVLGKRMKKYFPLSYLLLTGSYVTGGVNWVGNSTNSMVNWVSSMSQCEILKPYQFGSTKSNIIKKLKNGHGNLSATDIIKIATWIDLEVPCYGSYDANGNNNWGGNEVRWAEEHTNKAATYRMIDTYTKKKLAGTLDKGEITIDYQANNGKKYSAKDTGFVSLFIDKKYESGDKLSIYLPQGQKYLMVSMNCMAGEELVYVPNGVFTYAVPGATNVYPKTWTFYETNTITARIPEYSELTEKRNLAQNIYDLDNATNVYPHATAKSAYNNQAEFQERNAIDGFTANNGHGNYPYQSWGPSNTDGIQWMQVDFGHDVYVDEVDIYIRADFPHDSHYISATLEFSNGTTKEVVLKKTGKAQKITFDTVKTSYVKIKDLVPSDASTSLWEGITEFKVYGTEMLPVPLEDSIWNIDDEKGVIDGVEMGTTYKEFIDGFNQSVIVKENGAVVSEGNVVTGATIEFTSGDRIGKIYVLSVNGDVTGDGVMTVSDVVKLRVLIRDGASTLFTKAGDLDGNNLLDNNDIAMMRNKIINKK